MFAWPSLTGFRRQLGILRWLAPLLLVLLVVVYELGPSRWIYQSLGFNVHLAAEIVLFATVGPLLAFIILDLLGRWIDERETADLQSQLLAQANEKDLALRQLSDDTLQILFATSLLLATFKNGHGDLPEHTTAQIEATEQALDETIQRLRSHLPEAREL
jgi:hypothetical protein